MNSKSQFKFFTLLIIFSCLYVSAAPKHKCEIRIFTGNSITNLPKVRSFFKTTDLLISRILPKNRCKTISYSIVLLEKNKFKKPQVISQGKDKLRIYLSEDISTWNNDNNVFADLIAAALLKKSGTSTGENVNSVPQWLTHAILRKILRRKNPHIIPGTISFPGVQALVLSETKTNWLNVISKPMTPENGAPYQIYLEASEIILDGILRLPDGKQVLIDIIELSNKELNPEDLFRGAVIKKINALQNNLYNDFSGKNTDTDIVMEWLNYLCKISSVNVLNPCNATYAEKLFLNSELVKYYAKVGKKENPRLEERYCKIKELPEKASEIENLNSVILKKQRDLVRIAFAMPVSLQGPVYKIEKSLKLILNKKYDEFSKNYNKQINIFFNSLEKQHQLEVYLLKTEKEFVPSGYRYSKELAIIKEIKDRQKNRWPELNEYLNKFSGP